jgi:hypothetical protein
MGKDKLSREEGSKKATFAETFGKEKVEETVIDYKKCVAGFAIIDKGNNTRDILIRR